MSTSIDGSKFAQTATTPAAATDGATGSALVNTSPVSSDSKAPEQQAAAPVVPAAPAGSRQSALAKSANLYWGLDHFDEEIVSKYIQPDSLQKSAKGVTFKLFDGKECEWKIIARQDGSEFEMIEMKGGRFFMGKMSQDDADGMAAMALAKGWQSVQVSSNKLEDKEKLWLAAQTFGLGVQGYTPLADSPVWDQLKQRNPDRYEALMSNPQIGTMSFAEAQAKGLLSEKGVGIERADKPETAAPATFASWLDERVNSARSPIEKEGFEAIRTAVASGAVKLDDFEEKSIKEQYKARVSMNADGTVQSTEADGRGYNRVVDIFKAKGFDSTALQKLPEQEIIPPAVSAPKASAPSAPKA